MHVSYSTIQQAYGLEALRGDQWTEGDSTYLLPSHPSIALGPGHQVPSASCAALRQEVLPCRLSTTIRATIIRAPQRRQMKPRSQPQTNPACERPSPRRKVCFYLEDDLRL